MTNEEAVVFLKGYLDSETYTNRCNEAHQTAISAIEKQIPKKPDYAAEGYAGGVLAYDYAKCPVCEHEFEYNVNDWGCAFCQDCGQALDWGDE